MLSNRHTLTKNEPKSSKAYFSRPGAAQADPDLREYQRSLALSAVEKRAPGPSKAIQRRHKAKPLFDFDEGDGEYAPIVEDDFDDDPELAFALQESLDQASAPGTVEVTPSPRGRTISTTNAQSSPSTSASAPRLPTPRRSSSSLRRVDKDSDDEEVYGSRLETALAIANARPSRRPHLSPQSSPFGKSTLLATSHPTSPLGLPIKSLPSADDDDDMKEVLPAQPVTTASRMRSHTSGGPSVPPFTARGRPPTVFPTPQTELDDEIEEVSLFQPEAQPPGPSVSRELTQMSKSQSSALAVPASLPQSKGANPNLHSHVSPDTTRTPPRPPKPLELVADRSDSDGGDEPLSDWSRSSSPVVGLSNEADVPRPPSAADETWDAAQEMDPHAEEGEFARFMSQVNGRDLDDVRAEIDEEIKALNQQKRAAMRDSDDITQQMISQIMVRQIR